MKCLLLSALLLATSCSFPQLKPNNSTEELLRARIEILNATIKNLSKELELRHEELVATRIFWELLLKTLDENGQVWLEPRERGCICTAIAMLGELEHGRTPGGLERRLGECIGGQVD